MSEAAGCDRLLVNLASAYRGRGMTPDRVGALFRLLSRRAGLEQMVTPHQLRHSFASELGEHVGERWCGLGDVPG